ncbi:efflux RND transporter permease subunit [Leptospira sanjuanensis]|uniref:efflux RND transporter permease subunit n=1 Tax=Leptospira sanjuanensis TaxID=2879643 RepID=UPI001EE893BD|nr:efflux RND transporter permease subunit [Leptospira sanjuanensis]MCG6169748.1 efflux RND transporter permease subunit [Leptospira sanjuanensis]
MKTNSNPSKSGVGFAGKIAGAFVHSKLTPVLILFSLLLGLIAVFLTPKEEEPQISVPMIDIQLAAPGFSAHEVERKITEPVERSVWGLEGVEYVYSSSTDHGALVTVRFEVGQPLEPSLVKIHHKLLEIRNDLPPNVSYSSVRSLTIDDVPFLALTFSSDQRDDFSLRTLVAPLARELSGTPDLSKVELLGGRKRSVRVIADPVRLNRYGIGLSDLANALRANDAFLPAGQTWGKNQNYDVEVGTTISRSNDVRSLPIAQRGGRVIRVFEVADVIDGPQEKTKESILYERENSSVAKTAVTISFAKRKGTNVVPLSKELLDKAESFSKRLPPDVRMSVLRDYGSTASAKSNELIEHLLIATISVAILIALWMGLRASLVVSVAIPVTLALTLALYYFLGYTLNRVTLFALIFSIGILVDDAIVVVENIERHLKENPELGILRAALNAVSEVGNPTILATFTVIAAILPMAFVRGLMGPYMKPIPVGASLAMILSLLVAFIVTPWMSVRILKHEAEHSPEKRERQKISKLDRLYIRFTDWLLRNKKNSAKFLVGVATLLLISFAFVGLKIVKVKMLPFDDKDEFQILIDYDPKTTLEKNLQISKRLAQEILKNDNVEKVQIFAGEAAPFSFSGMVKHSFLRNDDWKADLHIVLKSKDERNSKSHSIIESIRPILAEFDRNENALTKVLEIPPGPPVLATFVAEIYGPSETERKQAAAKVRSILSEQEGVVDLDSSLRTGRPKIIYPFDTNLGGILGVRSETAARDSRILFSETALFSLSEAVNPEEITVDLSVTNSARSSAHPFHGLGVSTFESGVVSTERLFNSPYIQNTVYLNRKNLRPVEYVTSEFSGAEEAPVYGILKLSPKIPFPTSTLETPKQTDQVSIKWDGEWFITYEVFRDLGGAFAIVMILIYVLILAWFGSYSVPLVIMAPIPISLIGILPGHWFTGAYFTATSMIGFIAGAGIIVRNSIILVDFIESELKLGKPLRQAVIDAGVVRFRPMLLTAAAVVVGSSIMLFDPIFQGLAVSLIFGEVAATLLSRFTVPILYFWFLGEQRKNAILHSSSMTD